jgi:hypothetical protein
MNRNVSIYPDLGDFHATLVIALHASGRPSFPTFAKKKCINTMFNFDNPFYIRNFPPNHYRREQKGFFNPFKV